MRIVLKESRRDELAKKELDKAFSNMYIDVDYITDSTGEHRRIDYRNGDGVIMIYGERAKTLYICDDILAPIVYFSYTPNESKMLVKDWFKNKFELPVKITHHTQKGVLN
jgi:hypothetical protein